MRGLVILSVLTVWALNCASVPTRDTSGRHWSCDEKEKEPGARLAMLSINNKHFHGYKFQLSNITFSTVEKGQSDCKLHLELDLQETTCHIINPKSFEECDIRQDYETVSHYTTMANQTLNNISDTCQSCRERDTFSAEKMVRMCPDCPILLPLHSPEGLESVKAGLRQFNMDHNYTSYFKLMEVGRITSGYMMMTGMNYYAELAIVETECNAKSRIDTQACKPLCPDEAVRQLATSSSSYSLLTITIIIFTPHYYHHHTHSSLLPSSYSLLTITIIILTPHYYHHHIHSSLLPSSYSLLTITIIILTPHYYHHHTHSSLLPSSYSLLTITIIIFTPHYYHHHIHSSLLPSSYSLLTITIIILTPHYYHHHIHSSLLPSSYSLLTITIIILTPHVLPSSYSLLTITIIIFTPHYYHHHIHSSLLPSSYSLLTITIIILTPHYYHHHIHSSLLPSSYSLLTITIIILTPH
uniref:Cystatin fetuin-A-type domain-containing protein n=1 Tax=Oncorhynchus mykiss TaxID=8022 RepID=A0A8L0DVF1_ONCMY